MRVHASVINVGAILMFVVGIVSVVWAFHEIDKPIPELKGGTYKLELPTGQVIDMPRQ